MLVLYVSPYLHTVGNVWDCERTLQRIYIVAFDSRCLVLCNVAMDLDIVVYHFDGVHCTDGPDSFANIGGMS